MITKGQKINDRYEIVKSIGEGGMANVYLAKDTILDRKVAIKVLRGDLANDDKFIRRFQREALSASSLSHPNIVEMYDVGEDQGSHYIVMEYIEGKTLKQLLKKRGNLTVSEAVDVMLQLTDGISHAHDSYIIHRDLKPQNIMIQEDGQIKITDFGIAMALNSTQLTQTNSVMGSVHYLPPEQASGKGSTIKCDIYSMGILFYELLTGVLPFKGDNAVEIALKHMKDPIPSVRKQNSSVPQSVENIILKSTAKNPKNRYNDVKEMYQDLKKCLDEDVINQERYIYKYPEHENEDGKEVTAVVKKKNPKDEKVAGDVELIEEENLMTDIESKDKSSVGTKIIIWGLVAILLFLVGFLGLKFGPYLWGEKTSKDIMIPDVSGMSVVDAENVLKDKGFTNIVAETQKMASTQYKAGEVVKTDPIAGRKVKKTTAITIYESIGEETITLDDFKDQDVNKITGKLEALGLVVKVEKKKVDNNNSNLYSSEKIISQSPVAGTVVTKGTKVTLYVPDIISKYPDFVGEGWSVEEVQDFCDTNNITLTIKYQESQSVEAGKIIRQSRPANSEFDSENGGTLTITVAKAPVVSDDNNNNNNNNNNNDNNDNNNNSGDET